jgi:RNA polymerase sigma-32 factor
VKIGTTRAQRRLFFKMRRARADLRTDDREPTSEALAAALGVKPRDVEEMTQRLSSRDLSIDKRDDSEEGVSLVSMLASPGPDPAERLESMQTETTLRGRLKQGLQRLDPRERQIIERRYLAERPATLADLGEEHGVSRERIRQLEERAKRKLRTFMELDEHDTGLPTVPPMTEELRYEEPVARMLPQPQPQAATEEEEPDPEEHFGEEPLDEATAAML